MCSLHVISMSLAHSLAENKGKQSICFMVLLHSITAAGPLGFYLYDEGKSRTQLFKVYSISFLLYTSLYLSFPLFNGLYKTIKEYPRWLSQGLPILSTKAAHSRKSWLPFPQNIPDMKTINLMRTTSPNEVCGDLSISLDRIANSSGLCPRSGMRLHIGGFVAGAHSH